MRLTFSTVISCLLLSTVACKNNSNAQEKENVETTATPNGNPETAKRNTQIAPAFEGQTRVSGTAKSTGYAVEVIASGLGKPWGVTNFPGNRLIITEKSGFMYLISSDGRNTSTITGFPKVDAKGQGGMLDVALDPEFGNNRMLYWVFSENTGKGNHTAVAKGKLSADEKTVLNPTVIFRTAPTYDGDKHYGSRILFDKEGNIVFSSGERSDKETRPLAQDQSTYLGKIIKINRDGGPAASNPKIKGWKPEIFSTGHRNPQGMAIHPVTQEIWESEMGPKGGDEINRITAGKNYGWPTITYGEEYSGFKIGNAIGQKAGLEQPVYFWDPSVSPSGIDFYTGNIEGWKNNLMIGCLSGQKIIRLVLDGNKVVGEEWLLTDQNSRFRDVLNGTDGNLYAVTDEGKLFKISKK